MPNLYKVLGQAVPSTSSDIVTVPSGKQHILSSLMVANTTASPVTYRVHVRIAGAAVATSNAIVYDSTVAPNDTVSLTLAMSLDAADVVTVVSGTSGSLTVTAFGTEIS
jgi:hypothetical protein